MTKSQQRIALSVLLSLAGTATAAELTGVVRGDDKKPVVGAMVSLSNAKAGLAESVFSDGNGQFILKTTLSGPLNLRVRQPYFGDYEKKIFLAAKGVTKQSINLRKMTDAQEISDSLPAIAHFAQLPFKEGTPFSRALVQRDCLSCHQLGNVTTRFARTAEQWLPTVRRMHEYGANADESLILARAQFLSAGFRGTATPFRPEYPIAPELSTAKIFQYALPGSVIPHDTDIHPALEKAYTVDQGNDDMHVTDLRTGKTQLSRAPAGGMPPGGKFTLLNIPGGYGKQAPRGMHSLALAQNGKYYTTDSYAGGIGIFDPSTNTWDEPINIPGKTLYPHTIRADKKGNVWFTVTFSEQVGRLNTATSKVDLIDLPAAKFVGMAGSTIPYGIDVHPIDGSVWFSRMNADKIGKIDPDTLALTEYDSPVLAPRRMRFDKAGNLWVAGFSEGKVAKIKTSDFTATIYTLPQIIPGQPAAPYALGIHPDTQDVWVNEVMTNQVYRFIPAEERFIAYPLPLRGSYTRDMAFTNDGRVCMSNSPVPIEVVEGSVGEIICIKP